jgi:hypothetical protein
MIIKPACFHVNSFIFIKTLTISGGRLIGQPIRLFRAPAGGERVSIGYPSARNPALDPFKVRQDNEYIHG